MTTATGMLQARPLEARMAELLEQRETLRSRVLDQDYAEREYALAAFEHVVAQLAVLPIESWRDALLKVLTAKQFAAPIVTHPAERKP